MRSLLLLLTLLVATPTLRAQDANAALYDTGMHHSQVMNLLHNLTDVYGPRLTGGPGIQQASEWTLKKFSEWGLAVVRRNGRRADGGGLDPTRPPAEAKMKLLALICAALRCTALARWRLAVRRYGGPRSAGRGGAALRGRRRRRGHGLATARQEG